MTARYCGGVAPEARAGGLAEAVGNVLPAVTRAWQDLDLSSAFGAVWGLVRDTNAYIEAREPWKLEAAGDAVGTAAVVGDCLETLRVIALLAAPVIPAASAELWRRLGLPGTPHDERLPDAAAWGRGPAGTTTEVGTPLFPRLEART
jgi:methionyl-tRNA synthetase